MVLNSDDKSIVLQGEVDYPCFELCITSQINANATAYSTDSSQKAPDSTEHPISA